MRQRIRHAARKTRVALTTIAAVLTVLGIVTFTNFILEESIQTTMFGIWPALTAKDYHTADDGLQLMGRINASLKIINGSLGWLHPLAFVSYRHYAEATDFYIKGTRSRILAEAPHVLAGQTITFNFRPSSVTHNGTSYHLSSGPITVVSTTPPQEQFISVTGKLVLQEGKIFIRPE